MKSASNQYVAKGDNHPVKAKREKLADKIYLTVFSDNQGILLEEYAPKGIMTTKETYLDTSHTFRDQSRRNI